VDLGINKKLLLGRLKKEGLKSEDIDVVFLTHYHPDHAFLAAIFEKAIILDENTIYEEDKETDYEERIPGTNIKIIATPGHASEHFSLLIQSIKGIIVIAGDVFWWPDNERQETSRMSLLEHKDPFVKDEKVLLESRKKVLAIADWIIPGHGVMFRNNRTNKGI